MSAPFLSIDIETTGLDEKTCQILEIGIVCDDLHDREMQPAKAGRIVILHEKLSIPTDLPPALMAKHSALFLEQSIARTKPWAQGPDVLFHVSGEDLPLPHATQPTWFCVPKNLSAAIFGVIGSMGLPNDSKFLIAGKNFPSFDLKFLAEAGLYNSLVVSKINNDDFAGWAVLAGQHGFKKQQQPTLYKGLPETPTTIEELRSWVMNNVPQSEWAESWTFRHRHRYLDPGMLWMEPTDTIPPDLNECMIRAKLDWDPAFDHKAVPEAAAVARLVKLGMHRFWDRAPVAAPEGEIILPTTAEVLAEKMPDEIARGIGVQDDPDARARSRYSGHEDAIPGLGGHSVPADDSLIPGEVERAAEENSESTTNSDVQPLEVADQQ